MKRSLWRDPLIHFLLFGTVLFAGHALWATITANAERQLIVDTAEINRQAGLYAIENGRPPTDDELNGIILAHVEEAVLAREALRLGLDDDDTVIRRRLAQKMRLVADGTAVETPSNDALRTWFDDRKSDYVIAERRTIQHVFFSDEGREDPKADASSADLSDWQRAGDPFIVARQVGPITRLKLQQDFGEAFANGAFLLPLEEWSDPVRSPFGIHRVRAIEIMPEQAPDFDALRDQVEADWLDQARREASAQAIRDMITRYDVVVQE